MRKSLPAVGCAALLAAASMPAAAQSLEDIAGELVDNSVFKLELSASAFTQDLSPEGDREDNRGELYGVLTMETEAVVDEENYSWVNLELTALYGTMTDMAEGVFRKPNDEQKIAHWLDLKRLAFHREILEGDGEFVIGKEFINVGLAELYSPADRFNLPIAIDPTQTDEQGQWQVGFKRFIEDDEFSYTFLPFHEGGAGPDGDSRWLGASGDSSFTELPSDVSQDLIVDQVAEVAWENTGHLFRYEAIRDGYDWFAFLHHGQSAFPILKRRDAAALSADTIKISPQATTVGGGAAFVVDEWKIYGESTWQLVNASEDQDVLSYSVGFSYRETQWANELGLDEIKPIVEYAGEWVTDEQKVNAALVSNSANARPNRNTVLTKLEMQFDDAWSTTVASTVNLNDTDHALSAGVRYEYDDNLKFSAAYTQFNGTDGTYYGNWRENDLFKFGLEYSF